MFRNKNMKMKHYMYKKTFRYCVGYKNMRNELDLYNKTEIIAEARLMILIYYMIIN